jgi:hypothetical protein
MALINTTIVEQADKNDPSGTVFGVATTSPIGFYGKTPVAQRATGNNTALTTTPTTTAVATAVVEIQATLVGLGLMPAT